MNEYVLNLEIPPNLTIQSGYYSSGSNNPRLVIYYRYRYSYGPFSELSGIWHFKRPKWTPRKPFHHLNDSKWYDVLDTLCSKQSSDGHLLPYRYSYGPFKAKMLLDYVLTYISTTVSCMKLPMVFVGKRNKCWQSDSRNLRIRHTLMMLWAAEGVYNLTISQISYYRVRYQSVNSHNQ